MPTKVSAGGLDNFTAPVDGCGAGDARHDHPSTSDCGTVCGSLQLHRFGAAHSCPVRCSPRRDDLLSAKFDDGLVSRPEHELDPAALYRPGKHPAATKN